MVEKPPPLPAEPAARTVQEPADAAASGQGQGAKCANCGAEMTWDPDADALACAYCGARIQVPRAEGTIVERALTAAHESARGFGLELRALLCKSCGARVALGDKDTAAHCVFCGSSNVLAQAHNRNAIRPESLVPLDVSRAAVEQAFRRWAKGLWFRPTSLQHARLDAAIGVYLPFWTFDAVVHSDWSADAGYYYYVAVPRPVMVGGKMRIRMVQERRVRWVPKWGARDDAYDDLLVLASRGVDPSLAAKLGQFDLKQLVPYRPEYLAGWRAEEYQLGLEQGWERGQKAIEERQRARCSGDVPGDTQRDLRVANVIRDVRWKHVLLPIWSITYRHGGRAFPVLVHGQTGVVRGKAPLSWLKILGLVALIGFAALVLVAVLATASALS
jgi:DNA-directed RNA polymerase subunit RPC12/RpoP